MAVRDFYPTLPACDSLQPGFLDRHQCTMDRDATPGQPSSGEMGTARLFHVDYQRG